MTQRIYFVRTGDLALGCRKYQERIARHDQLRDVLYEAAASAALAPIKEAAHLLPGAAARPGDILIRRWADGKDGALDVTVTGPLAQSNVEAAAAESGAALHYVNFVKYDVTVSFMTLYLIQ